MKEHKPFVDGLAILRMHQRGTSTQHEWSIGCDAANDDEQVFRDHVARWFPEYELDSFTVKPLSREEK